MPLLAFISKIAEGLATANKAPRAVDRPSKTTSLNDVPAAKHKLSQPLRCNDGRYDSLHHWPEYLSTMVNCSLSKVGNRPV